MIGNRLGPYEITAKLGEGGMGEVYRATDSNLRREVAIKVLPSAFTEDKERLQRFEREAQLLAQLHHPNIASIFGLEVSGGSRALVMELIEGPTLADRLAEGALPLEEAVAIARQIAEALEAAHEKGIIHRDLKPQNIKTTLDGTVKVLDFGLAKAVEIAGSSSIADAARSPTIMNSPTLTAAGTQLGVILGTAAYMSPEQAKGAVVDKRADIWAFGVVLYEMLTGARLFEAPTVAETMAQVLTRAPDLATLPGSTPAAVRRLLRSCLERNPKNRLHDIADARLVLAEVERGEVDERAAVPAVAPRRRPLRVLFGGALLLLALAAGAIVARLWPSAPPPQPVYHLLTSATGFVHSARFGPDDTTVIYGEARGDQPLALFSTRFDAVQSRAVDMPSADVVGIASNGEMALILDRHHAGTWMRVGTLAQAGIAGGAPRALLEEIYDADIAPDASSFAVVRVAGGQQQLEFPVGKVLYRTKGWVSSPRISRDARRVAFIDHPFEGDDQGVVASVEADGKLVRLSEPLNFMHGVAWSADGREILASWGSAGVGTFIEAFGLDGSRRRLLSAAALLRLQDVAPNGRLLLTSDFFPVAAEGRLAGDYRQGKYSTWSGDTVDGISLDGTVFAGTKGGFLEGGEYKAYYARSDGSEPVILGPGSSVGMSPDGKWAVIGTLSRDRTKLRAVPIGPGDARVIDLGTVEVQFGGNDHVTFTADGRRIAFAGVSDNSLARGYVFDLDGSEPPRAVTPEGASHVLIAPDGRTLVASDIGEVAALYDVATGTKREITGAVVGEVPVAWSSASDAIFVWDRRFPVRVQRIEPATGRRDLAFEWQPADPSGVLYGLLTVTPDARYFLVRYRRGLSSLAAAEGLR